MVNPDGTWQRNTYDASGIRSMIAENGVTTEFMTFNGLVLSGYNKNGEQVEHYYYGNSLLTAEYTEYATDSYGEVTAETSLYYYLKNSHGDVIGFTDNNGTLVETYRYDAFGTLANIQSLNENGVQAEAETALSRFLYAGEQYDSVSGLYYLRARYYDTTVGRFTQEDVNFGDGRNLYTYVSNNPLKYTDPSGYEKEKNSGLIGSSDGVTDDNTWSMPNWAKVAVGTITIAGLAVATVMTGGAAAVITGAALSGAVVGGASSAVIGAVSGGISGGWQGAIDGAASGFMSGTLVGGIMGAASAGINIATGATAIVGKAHGSVLHKIASNMEAGKMAASGQYSQVGLNKALKTMGMNGTSRPDVIGVAKNGINKLVEVISPKQSVKYIENKMANMLSQNSGAVGKIVTWVRKLFK